MDSHGDNGYTVAQLCRRVEATINTTFPDEVWVRGVISGLKRSPNGHVYFDLIDASELGEGPSATLPVALFTSARQRVNAILRKTNAARMTDGVEIRIRGSVTYYPRQGRVQLLMSLIDPSYTLGQLEAARNQLLGELRDEGLLEANRSLSFPPVPLRVALVTSTGSAAEADFVSELRLSGLPFEITLFDARVQGAEAIDDLIRAFDAIHAAHPEFDVVALVRGGGARSDLAVFDHGRVARTLAACRLPVVVGVGHEIDTSVADLVAARSAKTPTACAGLLIEAVRAFDHQLSRLARQITARAQWCLTAERQRIDNASHRLLSATHRQIDRREHQLHTAEVKVGFLDPAANLARGWSIVHASDGTLVRSTRHTTEGDVLTITTADGRIAAVAGAAEAAP